MSYSVVQAHLREENLAKFDLTQGIIINGLKIPRYPVDIVHHGILLTARCDIAQLKAGFLNFLPIVPLRHWVTYDALLSIALSKAISLEKNIRDKLSDTLSQEATFLLKKDKPWKPIIEAFKSSIPSKILSEIREQTTKRDALFTFITQFPKHHDQLKHPLSEPLATLLRSGTREHLERLISKHEIADVHFLPTIHPHENTNACDGYVILFRQILSVPCIIASLLSLEKGEKRETNGKDKGKGFFRAVDLNPEIKAELDGFFSFNKHPEIEVCSIVRSPYLEFVMQRFANLFTRIGVENIADNYVDRISKSLEKQPSGNKGGV